MDICKQLIDVAKNSGCDAIKLQKRDIEIVYDKEFLNSFRDSPWGKTQKDQKMGLEFAFKEYQEIDQYCNEKQIEWFASAWDLKSQEFLSKFNLRYNKIASAMITYIDLLEKVAQEGRHTFISTGMSTYEDIDRAVKIFREKNCSFELMHTVSTYPMSDADANLNMIDTLRKRYNCDIGYSGHEVGLAISYAAAAKGITSLERHITLDRAMYGSDQPASIEPQGLSKLVSAVRIIEKALGNGEKTIIEKEIPIAKKLRAHIPFTSSGMN